jgi:hypothetical protein
LEGEGVPKTGLLFNDDGVSIYLDEDVPCLVNEWTGFFPSAQFRKHILNLFEIYQQVYQAHSNLTLLADTRQLQVIKPADLLWVANEVNPRYVELGCHYEAFIVPEDEFGKASINRYVRHSTSAGNFVTQEFASMAEAKSWLKSVQSVVPK